MSSPVALVHCPDYDLPLLADKVAQALAGADLPRLRGRRILLKPNLLCATPLACASAPVIAACASWLLDNGAKVEVGDSPAFGSVARIARAIGLEEKLRPLKLAAQKLSQAQKIRLPLPTGQNIYFRVSRKALEADAILSVTRVKAHKQMAISLTVKNCYGTVPGVAKAWYHTRYGEDRELFAACQTALWAALPPVWGFLDGVIAMSESGPIDGKPLRLGLLGASSSAPALDAACMRALGIDAQKVPIARALEARQAMGESKACTSAHFTCANPDEFANSAFKLPERLISASFRPLRLCKSCIKRIWKNLVH